MKKILLPLLAAGAILHAAETSPTPAAPASRPMRTQQQLAADKQALATRLVATLRIADQLKVEIAGMHASLDNAFAQMLAGPAAAHRDITEKHRAVMHKAVDATFELTGVTADVVRSYAGAFSEKELKDILAFYDSPSGKTFAAKSREMHENVVDALRSRKGTLDPKISGMLQEMNLELQAADTAAVRPAPSAK